MTVKLLILSSSLAFAASVSAQQVFTPADYGTATGGAAYNFLGAFDDQPVIGDLVAPISTVPGSELGANIDSFAGPRQAYIDFGADYSTIQIEELWTAYRFFSNISTPTPFEELWWSDTPNNLRGGVGTFTDIDSNDFNFGTTAVASTGSVSWHQDFDFSTSVTPAHRYLILTMGSNGFAAGRATELAIVTTTIPEPSIYAMALGSLALGLLCLRRKRNA
ncbi:hypothetical protein [Cerasicoccus arenae]|nr:hypothetical protein [Cerasicoccus arenae]MBK1859847.1 hypothetical protein [Cerasicoccus arenae]